MSRATAKVELPRLESGQLGAYSWPGGYPLYYVTLDGGTLCPDCARGAESEGLTDDPDDPQWHIIACHVNWEDQQVYCDDCNAHIESAYCTD